MSDNAWDDESVAAVLSKTNELLDKGLSTEETVKILVQAGLDSETAASIVGDVAEIRRAVKRGDLGYLAWLQTIIQRPFGSGPLGFILPIATVGFTLIAAFIGVFFFPPGYYPRIVLAIPGLIAGAVFFFVLSGLLYNFRYGVKKMFSRD
ncbi:MAG: hypothetical protein ISS65_06695 [Desulfobacterales bacterium]|uniref:Uncharacterized protein n=1 Tax=Candidatus Desulfatibia profunda TaxID=2841695 RepID=A0A8J6TJ41_9BACT|nr:hypothetical protein [Candidatus Desulfatibia profunda]MBL7179884.1 hypothetical protein [Desulfobacterales bacterium]